MTIGAVAFDVMLVTVGVAFVLWARKLWRNESPAVYTDLPSPRWAGSLAAWRGWVRVQCFVLPFIFAVFAPVGVLLSTGASGVGIEIVKVVYALVAVAAIVAGFGVWLLNRPKRLVPPHLRHQPGMIAELLGERCASTPPPSPPKRRSIET
jgi:hypothetical protein